MEQTSGFEILREFVEQNYDNTTDFARKVGISQAQASELVNGVRKSISAEMCLRIEKATGGRLGRHQLRPDLWKEPMQ